MKIQMIDEEHAKCSKCGDVKKLSEFSVFRKGRKDEYRISYCKDCKKKQQRILLLNPEKFLEEKYRRLKKKSENENIPFDLTVDDFKNIAKEQYKNDNLLCFYTGWKITDNPPGRLVFNSFSVDKIVPSLGYIRGNTVFCLNAVNTIKNNLTLSELKIILPDWYNKSIEHLKKNNINYDFCPDTIMQRRRWENCTNIHLDLPDEIWDAKKSGTIESGLMEADWMQEELTAKQFLNEVEEHEKIYTVMACGTYVDRIYDVAELKEIFIRQYKLK